MEKRRGITGISERVGKNSEERGFLNTSRRGIVNRSMNNISRRNIRGIERVIEEHRPITHRVTSRSSQAPRSKLESGDAGIRSSKYNINFGGMRVSKVQNNIQTVGVPPDTSTTSSISKSFTKSKNVSNYNNKSSLTKAHPQQTINKKGELNIKTENLGFISTTSFTTAKSTSNSHSGHSFSTKSTHMNSSHQTSNEYSTTKGFKIVPQKMGSYELNERNSDSRVFNIPIAPSSCKAAIGKFFLKSGRGSVPIVNKSTRIPGHSKYRLQVGRKTVEPLSSVETFFDSSEQKINLKGKRTSTPNSKIISPVTYSPPLRATIGTGQLPRSSTFNTSSNSSFASTSETHTTIIKENTENITVALRLRPYTNKVYYIYYIYKYIYIYIGTPNIQQ